MAEPWMGVGSWDLERFTKGLFGFGGTVGGAEGVG